MRVIFLLLLIFSLAGCGGQRQALMKDKFPYYPPHIQHAINNNRVVEGMDQEQVYLSLGTTLCKSTSYYRGTQVEVWAYEPNAFTGKPLDGTYNCYRARQRVYFERGSVVGWDNM